MEGLLAPVGMTNVSANIEMPTARLGATGPYRREDRDLWAFPFFPSWRPSGSFGWECVSLAWIQQPCVRHVGQGLGRSVGLGRYMLESSGKHKLMAVEHSGPWLRRQVRNVQWLREARNLASASSTLFHRCTRSRAGPKKAQPGEAGNQWFDIGRR